MLNEGYEQNVMGMNSIHFTFPQTLFSFLWFTTLPLKVAPTVQQHVQLQEAY